MKTHLARRDHLDEIMQIGAEAISASHTGLLRRDTIERWIAAAYSQTALEKRWQDHPMFVATDRDLPIAFADAWVEDRAVVLSALYTRPAHRNQGAGTSLLDRVASLAPSLPVTVDVMLGCRDAETFFEHRSFVPGEALEVMLFGERIVERRWYREPDAESVPEAAVAS